MNPKIIISINTAWNVYNFRSGLIKALVAHGYDVVAVTPDDEYASRLMDLGCRFISLPMDNNGTHPGRDLLLFVRYWLLLRFERPSVYLGYTVKPNVYGSIAAHALSIPVVNNIAGLGATFINNTYLTKIVRGLYKFALNKSRRVFFQNSDDHLLFTESGLVRSEIADRIPGSGIDLSRYSPSSVPALTTRPFRFLLVARMLKDKGIREFVDAARIVRQRFPETQFQLLGMVDEANSNAIAIEEIHTWEKENLIHYLGKTDDVRPYLADSDCVVLPSYREGVPRSLLEAAAMERPIITTDTPGCKDVVEHGLNGLLCKVRDAEDLAEKMLLMLSLTRENRLAMGEHGRNKVQSEFDEKLVIEKYLKVINEILSPNVI